MTQNGFGYFFLFLGQLSLIAKIALLWTYFRTLMERLFSAEFFSKIPKVDPNKTGPAGDFQ